MNTEQIIDSEVESFIDCFYGYLIKEGMHEKMPEAMKPLFRDIEPGDIAYILGGIEERYFADHTYFTSEVYENEVYWAIPYGEIEVEKDEIEKDDLDDWCISGEYAYNTLPAVTVVYNLDKVKQAIKEFKS